MSTSTFSVDREVAPAVSRNGSRKNRTTFNSKINVNTSTPEKMINCKDSNTNVVVPSHFDKLPAVNCASMYAGEVKQETLKHREVKFIKPAIRLSNSECGASNSISYALHGAKHEHLDFGNKHNKRSSISVNVTEICEQFSSQTLTDFEAEAIMSPFVAIHTRELVAKLQKQLQMGVEHIQWSLSPTAHESWLFDLRFYGDWWLTLQDYTAETNDKKQEEQCTLRSSTKQTELHNQHEKISGRAQEQRLEKAKRIPVISIIDNKAEHVHNKTELVVSKNYELQQQDEELHHDNNACLFEEEMTDIAYKTKPLLSADDVNDETCINALLADLTLRLRGPLFHLEMLHLDHFDLTPERIHVLFYKGILLYEEKYHIESPKLDKVNCSKDANWYEHVYCSDYAKACHVLLSSKENQINSHGRQICDGSSNERNGKENVNNIKIADNKANDENTSNNIDKTISSIDKRMEQNNLSTLSFSICNISSASLMILLLSLITAKREKEISISHLDLSYNALSEHSLRCFARLLPMTSITHLSVRGNCLDGRDSRTFHDFLRTGCAHLEELDLCFTHLSSEQIGILIECLPTLSHLRVLLLDGVDISSDKAPLLTKTVARSRLCKISLHGSLAADANTYVLLMHHKCEQHSLQYSYQMSELESLHVRKMSQSNGAMSFFEQFFVQSLSRGWRPPEPHCPTQEFYEYCTNDPSLYIAQN